MAAPKKAVGPKSDKEWRDALRLALNEPRTQDGKKQKALRLVARAVIQKAIDGDIMAAKEIGDRLDGRASQVVDHGGRITLDGIVRTIVDTDAQDSDS